MENFETNLNHDPEFLKERLKQRPLNRRKLLRRMLITVLMAVIFGTVASVTILLMQPIISAYLYPVEDEPERIVFPEEIIVEEILPEDMIADEREMQELQWAMELEALAEFIDYDIVRQIANDVAGELLNRKVFGIDEYISINRALMEISNEAMKSLVTVTGVTADVNWINRVFENRIQTKGIIIMDAVRDILIVADISQIRNADSIMLTFVDGTQYQATIRQYDRTTGLAILSIPRWQFNTATLEAIKPIDLGNSAALNLKGTPIIAVGRIVNNAISTCVGTITSSSTNIHKIDATYRLLTTDIYGSTNASGILVNLRGQLIGIINNSYNTSDARNIVSAIGISELRNLLEVMMNNEKKPYLGISGIEVTAEAHKAGVPRGAYITEVVIDSPAMNAGLQSGDIIVKIEEADIVTFIGLVNTLFDFKPDQPIRLTVKRQGLEDYYQFEVEVIAGIME